MGLCDPNCSKKNSREKYQKENNNLINQSNFEKFDGKSNIQIQLNSKENYYNSFQNLFPSNNTYNTFPNETKYKEELNSNFKYFNVYWYDPNKTNDFYCFKKYFKNVEFYKGYNLVSTIDFFKKISISEWIVVTPGSKGEELILNLENFECIKSFFIYCKNVEFHKKWANKIKKVGCLTSNPEILCQKFIEINKNYIIPNFNYQCKTNNDIFSNLNELHSNLYSSKLISLIEAKSKKKIIIIIFV